MKVDLRSLILGAALVLMGYLMGLMGSSRLFAQYFPEKVTVNLYTPGYLDIKHHGSLDIDSVDGSLDITQY